MRRLIIWTKENEEGFFPDEEGELDENATRIIDNVLRVTYKSGDVIFYPLSALFSFAYKEFEDKKE